MRRFLPVFALFFISTLNAQYVRIGEGVFLGTAAGPFVSSSTVALNKSRFASIYPKAVLGNMKHGDTIESLEFFRSLGSALNSNCNLTIWLKNTSLSDFGTGRLHFQTETTGATRIYDQNPAADIGTAEAFYQIPCNNSKFFFDSTKGENLMMLIEYVQTAAQPGVINWYFENNGSVNGYGPYQTKSFSGATFPDSLTNTSDYHPTVVFNFPRYDIDAQAIKLYTLGKLPVPLGNPDSVKLLVRNVGKKNISGLKVYTYLKGVNTGRDSSTFSLNKGAEAFFNLPSLNPSVKGMDTVIAEIADINKSNNVAKSYRLNNENIYGYRDLTQTPAPGGIGFNGTTGDFVARFQSNKSKAINQVKVNFSMSGRPFRVGIWDDKNGKPGKLVYQSDSLTSTTGVYILDFNKPVSVSGSFYVGVRQLGTSNIAFGYQEEYPVRPRTFFYAAPLNDTNWVDFAPNAPFRFLMEPRLQGDTDLTAISADFPRDTIDRYTMDTMAPRGTIKNVGFKDLKDSFDVICEISIYGRRVYREVIRDTLSSGRSRTYTFPKKFYPADLGEHEVRIYVKAKGDLILDNDTAIRKFYVGLKNDVIISTVFDPYEGAVYEYVRDTVQPVVTVQNPSYNNAPNFTVRCRIFRGNTVLYNRTSTLSLIRFQSRIIVFPTYKCRDTGRLNFVFTTEWAADADKSNDTQRVSVYVVKSWDVGIDTIFTPAQNVFYPVDKPITPRVTAFNDGKVWTSGTLVTLKITTKYGPQVHYDTVKVDFNPTQKLTFNMPRSFTPRRKGEYRAVFSVKYPGDFVPENDSLVQIFYAGFPYDYAAIKVVYPVSTDTLSIGSGPYAPKVQIRNTGFIKNTDNVPFVTQVWFGAQRIYQDIKTTSLDTGFLLEIDMLKTLNPINLGEYRVLLYTNYAADLNRKNDSVWSTFYAVIGKDASVLSIDSPLEGQEFSAREDSVFVTATIASGGRQPIGPVITTANLFSDKGNLIATASKRDTFLLAKQDKQITFKLKQLPDSGIYRINVRISSLDDQNIFNDTQEVTLKGYRRHDLAPISFIVPKPGSAVVNTSGSRPFRISLKQQGRDMTASAGSVLFEMRDSFMKNLLFADTGDFTGVTATADSVAVGRKPYHFSIAGTYTVKAWLAAGSDLFPDNDTIASSYSVVFNSLARIGTSLVRIYPNPGRDELFIQSDLPVSRAEFYDAAGRLVYTTVNPGDKLSTSALLPGMYLVRVHTAAGSASLNWIRTE